MDKKKKYYGPVLLYQGFGMETVPPSTRDSFNYDLAMDRGVCRGIDIINPYPEDDLNDNPFVFTTKINGKEILVDMNWSNFSYYKTSGRDDEEIVRVNVNERGTVELDINNNISFGNPAAARLEFVAYYSTPEHSEFLKNFRWGRGLGFKQKSYLLRIPAGITPQDVRPSITGNLPRNNGDIIAVSISCASQDRNLVVNRRFSVSENGTKIIEGYNGVLALPSSGRRDWIFKKRISPASTFTFECEPTTNVIVDEFYYVTFYFDN